MSDCAFLSLNDFPEPLNKLFHPRSLFGMNQEKSLIKCHRFYTLQDNFLFGIINIAPGVYNESQGARLYCSMARCPPSRSNDTTASEARETTSSSWSISCRVKCSNTKSTGSIPSGGLPMPTRTL